MKSLADGLELGEKKESKMTEYLSSWEDNDAMCGERERLVGGGGWNQELRF